MSDTSLLVDETSHEQAEPLDEFCMAIADLVDRKELDLPVLPEVPSKVLAMTMNPEMNINELADLIHRDQALAGHVLRISNSAAYAGARQIASLTQAITRLGARLVGDIAFSISLQSNVFRIKGYESVVKQLWNHSLASGLFGKEIARTHRRNIEGQYLCGLLHTIGKPVILQAAIDLQDNLGLKLNKPTANILMDDFHASVGSILTYSWGLPDIVSKTCLYYQQYEDAPVYRDETAATYLSGRLAMHLNDPAAVTEEAVREDPAFQELNFYQDDIQRIFDHSEQITELLAAMTI